MKKNGEQVFEEVIGEVYRGIFRLAEADKQSAIDNISILQNMLSETKLDIMRNLEKEKAGETPGQSESP